MSVAEDPATPTARRGFWRTGHESRQNVDDVPAVSVGLGLIRENPSADKSGVLQGHSLSPYPVVCRELPRTGVDRRMGTPKQNSDGCRARTAWCDSMAM